MPLIGQQIASFTVSGAIALITTLLLTASNYAGAEVTLPPQLAAPFQDLKYHVNYNVAANGTYTETHTRAQIVLNDLAIQYSSRYMVGMPTVPMFDPQERIVEIQSAYTLKKSGQRFDAAPLLLQQQGAPVDFMPLMPGKLLAFKNVDIGDTLMLNYTIHHKKAISPQNVVINEIFPKFSNSEDVEISLVAPSLLNLRIDTFGADNGSSSVQGAT